MIMYILLRLPFWSQSYLRQVLMIGLCIWVSLPLALRAENHSSFHPDTPHQVRWAEALIQRGDYQRAINILIPLELSSPSRSHRITAGILSAELYSRSGKGAAADRIINELRQRELDLNSKLKLELNWLQTRYALQAGLEQSALFYSSLADKQAADPKIKPNIRQRSIKLHQSLKIQINRGWVDHSILSSPWLNGIASTLIPGLGQALAGSPIDMISGLLMIAIPGVASYYALQNGEKVFGISTAMVTGLFYLGNISNAIQVSIRRRETDKKKAREKWVHANLPTPKFKFKPFSVDLDNHNHDNGQSDIRNSKAITSLNAALGEIKKP